MTFEFSYINSYRIDPQDSTYMNSILKDFPKMNSFQTIKDSSFKSFRYVKFSF